MLIKEIKFKTKDDTLNTIYCFDYKIKRISDIDCFVFYINDGGTKVIQLDKVCIKDFKVINTWAFYPGEGPDGLTHD